MNLLRREEVRDLGVAAYLAIHLIQLLGLYIPLTYFGGLWSGAESQGRHGWIAALLAAVAVVLLFMGIDGIAVLMQRPTPNLLLHGQAIAFFRTNNNLIIYPIDLLILFVGFWLYGLCWRGLRVRGRKEWLVALLVSVLLLVIHEAAEHGRGIYSTGNGASMNQTQIAPTSAP